MADRVSTQIRRSVPQLRAMAAQGPYYSDGSAATLTDAVKFVQGYVYRANYQMRLVYARLPGNCVLMGQEIIERSVL